ncbi:MAG: 4-alpha-glucanotransferase [Gammaproteobacteria bacterium]|nr:4-alpha-glucanotransferase [Gammaproteobacteria bacterium]MCP5136010.1 4-alpha-glucanotransferase [Gammaproteobacteria bacterium]
MHNPLHQRRAGVLLHITSLPGARENGEFGVNAFRFVDFLAEAGITVWQVLPLGPTLLDGSPYQSPSSFAGNPDLICLDLLARWGWVDAGVVESAQLSREAVLAQAARDFCKRGSEAERNDFKAFNEANVAWLEPYAFFRALKKAHAGAPWWDWEVGLRDREAAAMDHARGALADDIATERFTQFVFDRQWHQLRTYANERGVHLFGDLPIFVAEDSAEVWANRSYFDLDAEGHPRHVAGVPPDYFSETGQRWGNPLYDWEAIAADNFRWWAERLKRQFDLYDIVRIDHFRGFEAFWRIEASCKTAIDGVWVKAPGKALFDRLRAEMGELPIVAEDLGIITAEVDALRRGAGMPGMKILQFAFGGDASNPYLPHNHELDSVVYTGTHDNDTTLGWFGALDANTRRQLGEYLGKSSEDMPWPLIRAAFASVARLAVVPMQDLLGLDGEHRMNMPGKRGGTNWRWRFTWEQLEEGLAQRVKGMVYLYGRRP